MIKIKVKQATTWEEVEEYTAFVRSCISPTATNYATAKVSWENDRPRPLYALLDVEVVADDGSRKEYKGYIRFLAHGIAWLSDYYGLMPPGYSSELRREVFIEAINQLGIDALTIGNSYDGIYVIWTNPPFSYQWQQHRLRDGEIVFLVRHTGRPLLLPVQAPSDCY